MKGSRMAEKKNKIAALDIGEVCIHIEIKPAMEKLGIEYGSETYKSLMGYCDRMEWGEISGDEFLDRMDELSGKKFSREQLIDIWNSIMTGNVDGMADAVERAAARGWKFVYLSNTNPIQMEYFLKHNSFCHHFCGRIFSYEAKSMKPDAGIYKAFEEQFGIPDVYFDDRQANIDAAKARKWNAQLFRSASQLDELLK